MQAPTERPSSKRVWLVTGIFFTLIASGGTLLILSLTLPGSESQQAWLAVVGMTLVGIPWAFWLLTCCYRSLKHWQFQHPVTPVEATAISRTPSNVAGPADGGKRPPDMEASPKT